MSLYNLLFGVNPLSGLLLQALGTTTSGVPRFRDCYIETESGEDRIAIHTRTGGGNRAFYEAEERCRRNFPDYFEEGNEAPAGPWNCDLRALPGFLYDEDDGFDSTYATFYYRVPDAFRGMLETLKEIGAGTVEKPSERWQRVLNDLQSGSKTAETERALKVGEAIFGQINEALSKNEGAGASQNNP